MLCSFALFVLPSVSIGSEKPHWGPSGQLRISIIIILIIAVTQLLSIGDKCTRYRVTVLAFKVLYANYNSMPSLYVYNGFIHI